MSSMVAANTVRRMRYLTLGLVLALAFVLVVDLVSILVAGRLLVGHI